MDFLGFEIFDSRIFLEHFGKYFLGWLERSRDSGGFQNNIIFVAKNCCCAKCPRSVTNVAQPNLLHHLIPSDIFKVRKFSMGLNLGLILVRDFIGSCWKPEGFFWGIDFLPLHTSLFLKIILSNRLRRNILFCLRNLTQNNIRYNEDWYL